MTEIGFNFPDRGDSHHADVPAALLPLFRALWGPGVQLAIEAARELAMLGDPSIIPLLIREKAAIGAELSNDRFCDSSESRREAALTLAIISLLPPDECDRLSVEGTDEEKKLIAMRRAVGAAAAFWGG